LMGEYVQTAQVVKNGNTSRKIGTSSWQLAASYVITGEKVSFQSVTPRREFNPHAGSFGAVELAGRYTQLNVDSEAFIFKFANPNTSASRDRTWTAGVNWYFNKNLKLQLNYEQSAFKGGSTKGDRKTEKVILSQFQVAF
jgi:phosphate-selective porin OprO/OprP